MIRPFDTRDLNEVMSIWLNANLTAHDFIEKDYWLKNYDYVKEEIQNAQVYVYDKNDVVYGFIGIIDNYIAGVFVLHSKQSNGIGKTLLDFVKNQRQKLILNVYQKNSRAVSFYLREKFIIADEKTDDNSGETELLMEWSK